MSYLFELPHIVVVELLHLHIIRKQKVHKLIPSSDRLSSYVCSFSTPSIHPPPHTAQCNLCSSDQHSPPKETFVPSSVVRRRRWRWWLTSRMSSGFIRRRRRRRRPGANLFKAPTSLLHRVVLLSFSLYHSLCLTLYKHSIPCVATAGRQLKLSPVLSQCVWRCWFNRLFPSLVFALSSIFYSLAVLTYYLFIYLLIYYINIHWPLDLCIDLFACVWCSVWIYNRWCLCLWLESVNLLPASETRSPASSSTR